MSTTTKLHETSGVPRRVQVLDEVRSHSSSDSQESGRAKSATERMGPITLPTREFLGGSLVVNGPVRRGLRGVGHGRSPRVHHDIPKRLAVGASLSGGNVDSRGRVCRTGNQRGGSPSTHL